MIIYKGSLRGEPIEVDVSPSGRFEVYHDGDTDNPIAVAYQMDQALRQAEKVIRNYKRIVIEVPFTHATDNGLRPAIAIGRHARTRAILIKVDGKADSLYAYGSQHQLKPNIPASALKQREKAKAVIKKANDYLDKWNEKWRFNLAQAVDDAIREQQPTTLPNSDA